MPGMVTSTQLDEAHTKFCEQMGFEASTWRSIFEYVLYIGFRVINVARHDVRAGDEILLPDSAIYALKLLEGPHAATVVSAYKIRRYSFIGRIRAVSLLPIFAIAFMGCVAVAIVMDLKESW